MAYIIKNRTLPGSPFMAEYTCETCGRFELLVTRDENGDPPPSAPCKDCGTVAELALSCPKIAFWTRAIVPINPPGATRHDKPDPRALDTSKLADGRQTKKQWRKEQLEITRARRHAKRIKAGRAQKRIQVDSAGVK
jgi:hypothetical protein